MVSPTFMNLFFNELSFLREKDMISWTEFQKKTGVQVGEGLEIS